MEKKLKNDKFDDFLVNVLIKTVDPSWENQGTEFEFPGIYDDLKAILDNKESEQIALLKNYLQWPRCGNNLNVHHWMNG